MNRLRALVVSATALPALLAPAALAGPDPCRYVSCRTPVTAPKDLVVAGGGTTAGEPDWVELCARLGQPPVPPGQSVNVPGHGSVTATDLCNIFVNGQSLCAFLMSDPVLGPIFVAFCTGAAEICQALEDNEVAGQICELWSAGRQPSPGALVGLSVG